MNTEWKPIAHWYAVDAHGAATLCTCEEDARETAAESAQMFPNCAPYTAVQLAPVPAPTSHPIPTGATGEDEQSAFERWFERTCPSGDDESVQRQWEASSDYADFHAPAAGDALDAARWRSFRSAITRQDLDWLERMDTALLDMGCDVDSENPPNDAQVDAAADSAIAQQSQRKEA